MAKLMPKEGDQRFPIQLLKHRPLKADKHGVGAKPIGRILIPRRLIEFNPLVNSQRRCSIVAMSEKLRGHVLGESDVMGKQPPSNPISVREAPRLPLLNRKGLCGKLICKFDF